MIRCPNQLVRSQLVQLKLKRVKRYKGVVIKRMSSKPGVNVKNVELEKALYCVNSLTFETKYNIPEKIRIK